MPSKLTSQFSSDTTDLLFRQIEGKNDNSLVHSKMDKDMDINDIFEISRTVETIQNGGYEKIALQFPDELLSYSIVIARTLMEKTNKKVFILADTSYGSCCVDEIAAQHVNADFIVHYGRSCLSPTARIPVLYVFGRAPIDIHHCVLELENLVNYNKNIHACIMYDVMYHYCIDEIISNLHDKGYKSMQPSPTHTRLHNFQIKSINSSTSSIHSSLDISNPCKHDDDNVILFIGSEGPTLSNLLMTKNHCNIISYNPATKISRKEGLQVNKALARRYYMVQKAKDADVIGIVVGTLGVVNSVQLINSLKELIKATHKKSYVLAMGKLNPAKLANFSEIDVFVLVACPETTLIESKEFWKPIITPFELKMALGNQDWTGYYETDITTVKNQVDQVISDKNRTTSRNLHDNNNDNGDDDDEPHFSLITGTYKMSKKMGSSSTMNHSINSSMSQLSLRRDSDMTLIKSPAAQFLSEREWKGLEVRMGETEVVKAKEGRHGIAKGYTNEI